MVYVDDAKHPFGRMLMCHMVADSTWELLTMADILGLSIRYTQHPGTEKEHFDICQSKRALAINKGAVPISQRELGLRLRELILRERRNPRSCHEPSILPPLREPGSPGHRRL